MGLPGQHIVETGLARLAALWPVARQHAQLPDFKPVATPADAQALAEASAIYNGTHLLDETAFANLVWLKAFANSGRQLLMCHALRLLEGWNLGKRQTLPLAQEAAVLDMLSTSVGPFAGVLDLSLLPPLQQAFMAQLRRVQSIRCHTPQERLTKALSLLSAARATRQPATHAREVMPLLDHALAQLIAGDGGPVSHSLVDYAHWVTCLLQADDLPYSLNTRNALDRARPFLSMTLGADQAYCFKRAPLVSDAVANTAPLRFAPTSQVARITAGRAVAIALPGQLAEGACLNISSHGHELFRASLFLHDGSEDQNVSFLSNQALEQGHLLEQAFAATRRVVFVSPKGDDMRFEDEWQADGQTRWMALAFNPEAKISIARAGNHATIALGHRNLWQLTLRGGVLLPPQSENELIVEARPASQARVRWALKRISRSNTKSEKPETPELPF